MNGLYHIKLTAIPDGWRLFSIRKSDGGFASFRQQILRRDDYSCRYCGFRAEEHQEIVNLDHNYYNNKLDNLVTACCFCAQCSFLDSVGKENNSGGVLIYLPEISQRDLNAFCHVLFSARFNNSSYAVDARDIYYALKERMNILEQQFGKNMSNAMLFGRTLLNASQDDRTKIERDIMPSIRLLPVFGRFIKVLEDWSQAMVKELSP